VDGSIGQSISLALRAGAQDYRAHGGCHAHTDGGDVGADELHRVVDSQASRHHAAGAVYIHLNVALRVLIIEEEELGDYSIGYLVVDGRAEEDDAVAQQAGIYVVYALPRLLLSTTYGITAWGLGVQS
jgi:hypothetical protein